MAIDEALSVGEAFFQQKCYNRIRELSQKATVLIVSHDLNSITKFCKRLLVMNNDVLIFDENAKNQFVKPSKESYSGKMDAIIDSFYYQIDKIPFGEYCEFGPPFFVKMAIRCSRKIDPVIIGYQVRDKYGNETFGETSLTSGNADVSPIERLVEEVLLN